MIVKEATESIKIKKLREILKRTAMVSPIRKGVEDELAISLAGYRGEKSLDFHLEMLPEDDCFIFHDLRIPRKSSYFQLDILILTSNFFLIIEVKNMAGTLIFDRIFHQLIRILNGVEETFPDPISQLYRQTFLFKEWLKRHRITDIPIESLVIISNPHTRIKTIPEKANISKIVTHSSNLLARFHQYQNKYKEEKISKKEIKKLYRQLLKQHTQNSSDLFQLFSYSEKDLLKGVACPKCESLPMDRMRHQWFCKKCLYFSKDAHIEALKGYALLLSSSITNRECCDFLQISSRHSAKYLLKALNLPVSSSGRHTKYDLDSL
ncbi:nuclease-related domain-containing protein [Fictibacillus barbaricus]|uniref:NERD domain-containing protein n=1 Tax=Fictibacillus barbaricus TaxID=182136 RepID=A0ABU1U179_9BACL|nr:nuclease-related domain-containing protein [Fictibacillus barbaricus]MDR7073234.1 hypothetical protein [Fictibacillus barbaricus]